jgi:hypothetical protein
MVVTKLLSLVSDRCDGLGRHKEERSRTGQRRIMPSAVRKGVLREIVIASVCATLIGFPVAGEPVTLRGYNAAMGESSISGISSGAFMAVQFATAWSSVIKGVGVIAGGRSGVRRRTRRTSSTAIRCRCYTQWAAA